MKKFIVSNFYSLSFVLLGIINIVGYLFPFIVFKGVVTSFTNGYNLFSWFNSQYDEGFIFASTSIAIFSVAIITLVFGLVSIYFKNNMKKSTNKVVATTLLFLLITTSSIGLLLLFKYTEQISTKYIFSHFQTPTVGYGVIILFAFNVIVSIFLIVFKVVRRSKICTAMIF